MISFKNTQKAPPSFDYYLETDLDSFDDQPVDYSKKYADQDSYEDCRRTKSVLKTNEFPAEVSQTIKQTCNDEVKVYCIEGTPLTISSASSFCDLREVGTSNVEKPDMKLSFSSINDSASPESFEVDIKKTNESLCNKNEETSPSKEKDEIKEAKSVSFRNSNDISKASSPLMFSRSSSIASLNSFEQHSIVDDRSSVSVFSALTSGLISPSDLPDSPGEIMSPALTDKASSPKIDVTKIDCNSECDNVQFCEKVKVGPENIVVNNGADDQIPDHAELLEAKEYIPVDSFKSGRNSEEDNDVLVEHLEVSNDSLDIDEVFENPEYENMAFTLQNEEDLSNNISKSDDESDGDDDILLQHCIQLGMPNTTVDNKSDINKLSKMDYQPHSQNVSLSQIEMKKEVIVLIETISESDEKENPLRHNREEEISKELSQVDDELKTLDTIKSVEDSDDDDDELLQRCIQLGMPENTSDRTVKNTEGHVKTQHVPHSIANNAKNDRYSPSCAKSDDESDGDDILLQHCIQLGMPNKPSRDEASGHIYKGIESCDVLAKSNASQVPMKLHPMKSDVDFDGGESDRLLQHCIHMGMPKESYERKKLDKEVFKKPEYNHHLVNYQSPNDLRDNCPDGVSDGDEDDDMLAKCINAGMPSPKTTSDIQTRLYTSQTGNSSRKLQIPNRLLMSDTSIDLNRKFCHPRLPQNQPYASVHTSTTWLSNTSFIDVDSMRIYQTEDTPILSPSASISDLSSLSINESFLNNSRNSDCSSESDDDELLLQCIRSGMPEARRAVA